MRARTLLSAAVLVFATACITTHVVSQDKGQPKMSPEEEAMMKKWMEFATPNENHKLLATKVGKWSTEVTFWPAPGAPPQTSEGSSEFTMIMDGRYLSDNTEGNVMDMPFHGHGLTGYDNMKKKFVGMWIDNMGTGFMVAEGTYDAATKTFSYKSEMPHVETGKYVPCRSTETITDDDHWTMQMFGPGPDGKEMKVMEIKYTRKG